jgi:hypothetical protein
MNGERKMPTGYTADVQSGKVTEFKDFAIGCARAFGALITMRDEPADAPVPDEFKPSDYYAKSIVERKARVAKLEAMTPAQAEAAAQQVFKQATSEKAKWLADKADQRHRYEAMIAKVTAWPPPTDDHTGLKSFMIEQLQSSLKFDCGDLSYWKEEPEPMSGAKWLASELEAARRSLAYSEEEGAKEVARAKERTAWIKALKASLA